MWRSLLLLPTAAMCALADAPILPVADYEALSIDMRTGERTPGSWSPRGEYVFWDASAPAGSFTSRPPTQLVLDWGDTQAGTTIDIFRFYYATDAQQPVDIDVSLFSNENGSNSVDREPLGLFRFFGLPGGRSGLGTYSGWIITVTPTNPIEVAGPDLDGDGLVDFGYSFHFRTALPSPELIGPSLHVGDPVLAPGIEDLFDRFSADPNSPADPNGFVDPSDMLFDGTFWFGGAPYAQFRFQLVTMDPPPGCPQAGCESADIDPPGGNCLVDLGDLAAIIGGFGTTSGATREMGDIEPPGGDGDVDLADLAVMINAFGADCQ